MCVHKSETESCEPFKVNQMRDIKKYLRQKMSYLLIQFIFITTNIYNFIFGLLFIFFYVEISNLYTLLICGQKRNSCILVDFCINCLKFLHTRSQLDKTKCILKHFDDFPNRKVIGDIFTLPMCLVFSYFISYPPTFFD